jgi:hypothetical protein
VGVIVAAVTGGMLVSKNAAINQACPVVGGVHECSTQGRSLINGAKPLDIANGIGWGLGIAGVVSGTVLVIVSGKTVTTVAPSAQTGGVGLRVGGTF